MPHSNQDTQTSNESYNGTLKCCFFLETKGLQSQQIDWLMWRLITKVASLHAHGRNEETRVYQKCECEHWEGHIDHGSFVAMFVNSTYLHIYDNEFDDEETGEDHHEEP
jgi:hypothetical protein